jgi:hypothetical protein
VKPVDFLLLVAFFVGIVPSSVVLARSFVSKIIAGAK